MDANDRRNLIDRMDNEPPIVVRPSIAKEIGLNEAIVLQQLMYWLNRSGHIKDGKVWVYKTYDEWTEEFPFWSYSTVRRTIKSLRDMGLVETTDRYNKMKIDNTLWYTIPDYPMSRPSAQNEQTGWSKRADTPAQNEQANNQRLPESTYKDDDSPEPLKTRASAKKVNDEGGEVFSYLDTNGVVLTSILSERYHDLIDEYGADVVLGGMRRAKERNKLGVYKYVLDCVNTEQSSRKKRKGKATKTFTPEEQDFLKEMGF